MAKKKFYSYCSITPDGRLQIEKRDVFVENLIQFAGVKCKITIEKLYDKHSNNQREYYFAVVVPCCQEGILAEWNDVYTRDETHLLLKENLLYDTKVNERTGEILKIPRSISNLDLMEMIDYIERCINLIAEFFGIIVPPADKDNRVNTGKVLSV